ncbi:MAG: GNAT family N-acetyltransferase [Pseudomonadota bacterium]
MPSSRSKADVFRLTAADRDEADLVLRAAFERYVRQLGRDLSARGDRNLDRHIAEGSVFGVRDGDALARVLAGVLVSGIDSPEVWQIKFLAVHPDHQGKGLSGQLIAELITQARASGAREIRLHTAAMMTRLIAHYESFGFTETHRAPPDHDLDTNPRVHMRLTL